MYIYDKAMKDRIQERPKKQVQKNKHIKVPLKEGILVKNNKT